MNIASFTYSIIASVKQGLYVIHDIKNLITLNVNMHSIVHFLPQTAFEWKTL
jgi:hypothetical protein